MAAKKPLKARVWWMRVDQKKYVIVLTDKNEVIFNWGKVNSSGQTNRTKYSTYEDAEAATLKKVYDKKDKGYGPAHIGNLHYGVDKSRSDIAIDDIVVDLDPSALSNQRPNYDQSNWRVMADVRRALTHGDITKHEEVFDVVQNFTDEVNAFLKKNKRQNKGIMEEFARLKSLWGDLQEKFEDAETAMEMAEARASMTLERL